jgi:hypothetical protein
VRSTERCALCNPDRQPMEPRACEGCPGFAVHRISSSAIIIAPSQRVMHESNSPIRAQIMRLHARQAAPGQERLTPSRPQSSHDDRSNSPAHHDLRPQLDGMSDVTRLVSSLRRSASRERSSSWPGGKVLVRRSTPPSSNLDPRSRSAGSARHSIGPDAQPVAASLGPFRPCGVPSPA